MELAFTLRARLLAAGVDPKITVLCKGQEVMPRYTTRVAAVIRREAERRGIEIRTRAEVVAVEKDAVVLADDRVPCDLAVWATGAAPVPLFENTALPLDAAGFVRVEPTLQVVGYEDLFAVGDCASIDGYPWIPKAGVYAVREGPVLHDNLRARCKGRPLRAYRPQRDFLALLALGEGQAIGAKWGMSLAGSGMWRLKDFIDRRFVTRFQVLTDAGDDAPDFPSPEEMGMDPDEMVCGGCAAKVGASPLEHALARLPARPADPSVLVGLARPADAAVVELPRGDIVRRTSAAVRASALPLRRRLRADHTCYQFLLDRARQYRCQQLLSKVWLPGKCLADELGYLEVNSFYRAIRRWTGVTYSEYKTRLSY